MYRDFRFSFCVLILCTVSYTCALSTANGPTQRYFPTTVRNIPSPEDYHYIETFHHLYKLHITPATVHHAKEICEQEDAMVFYPTSHRELNTVLEYWQGILKVTFPERLRLGTSRPKDGFTMLHPSVTVNSMFHNWDPNLPINTDGIEDCIQMTYTLLQDNKTNIIWLHTVNCGLKRPFMCKMSVK